MVLLENLIQKITDPTSEGLFYHLVLLFVIQIILLVTIGHWARHRRDSGARRLLLVGAGFCASRVLVMLAALLGDWVSLAPSAFVPPLERFVEFSKPGMTECFINT